MDKIYIVVGLGNPSKEYELTRHNIGFRVVDALADEFGICINKSKFKALIGDIKIGDSKIILVKPQTYMNSSGESVKEICDWYKIPLENLIVVYDDIDIEWKKLRIRPSGSAGSHNGLKSVIGLLNSKDFPRVRVGIGKPPENWDLVDYVLGRFSDDEENDLGLIIKNAREAIECIIKSDVNSAMNKFNR